ncbi:hypothetical protein KSF73_11610 [Burkholderiaceae bacterium DAT-1]|nr:hypothetical protein [Burkholderiaceae bacterium DAT-1]
MPTWRPPNLGTGKIFLFFRHMTHLANYQRLWDGTEQGWVLWRHDEDRVKLTLTFSAGGPTLENIKALRSVISSFKEQPAVKLFASLKGINSLELGDFESRASKKVAFALVNHGLVPEEDPYHITRFTFVNELGGALLVIEDNILHQLVVEEAIKNHIPIRRSEC